jgi:hypothetical protein
MIQSTCGPIFCGQPLKRKRLMAEKFDPAPFDRHAEDPAAAVAADREMRRKLAAGLEGSFPASDPPSSSQPAPSRHDAPQQTLWQRVVGFFK